MRRSLPTVQANRETTVRPNVPAQARFLPKSLGGSDRIRDASAAIKTGQFFRKQGGMI